jgi:hypothetical protein
VAQFDRIPDSYIEAASSIRFLFRHASVGANINDGLDCLMNNFSQRPAHCDRDLPPDQIVFDPKYDRSRWRFEFHSPPPNQNPGWWNKVNYFIERVNSLTASEPYDAIAFKFGYVDATGGSAPIDVLFFNNDPNDSLPSVEDLEALQAAHPDKLLIWWTMGVARLSSVESQRFNEQMRSYAAVNNLVLMDVAAIESHRPDGSPCFDNQNQGIEALCDEYTEETDGGHLNALGKQRMAKAVWVLMARVAGWNGN